MQITLLSLAATRITGINKSNHAAFGSACGKFTGSSKCNRATSFFCRLPGTALKFDDFTFLQGADDSCPIFYAYFLILRYIG